MNESQAPPVTADPPELIVDLDHQDIVTAQLRDYELWPSASEDDHHLIDKCPELGLARLTLPAEIVELDALFVELRRHFAGRYGGWIPVIGKNRTVQGIIGSGTSKPMVGGVVSLGTSKPMLLDEPNLPAAALSIAPGAAGAGVTVGLIDTPFAESGALTGPHAVDFDPVLSLPTAHVPPRAGHGIFVVSKILERAPGAQLIVKGLLDPTTGEGDTWTIAKAMLALASQVQVMNLSFGSYTADGEPPLVLSRAIELISRDVVVVAAAGNHGIVKGWQNGVAATSAAWPAASPNVVAVGARNKGDDGLADFTPKAPWITCTAPGEEVAGAYLTADVEVHDDLGQLTPKHFEGSALWSGTSFAAATVSGAIAAKIGAGAPASGAVAALVADTGPNAVVRKYTGPP